MKNIFISKDNVDSTVESPYMTKDDFLYYWRCDRDVFSDCKIDFNKIEVQKILEPQEYFRYKIEDDKITLFVIRLYALLGKHETGKEMNIEFYNVGKYPLKVNEKSRFIDPSCAGQIESTHFYGKDHPYISEILKMKTFRYRELDLLGHYTKMKTAVEHILPLKKLLINKLCLSNDPVESKKSVSEFIETNSSTWEEFIKNNHKGYKLYKFYQNSVRYISFTKKKGTREVYEAPAMWAHYGQKHKGVCLVFDKKLLEELIKRQFPPPSKVKKLSVKYNLHCTETKEIKKKEHKSLAEFFLRNSKDVLFKKNKDWREESEYRYVVISNDDSNNGNDLCFLENINEALIAVVLGIEFNENYKCAIRNLIKNSHVRDYELDFKDGKFVLKPDESIVSPENILQYLIIDEI